MIVNEACGLELDPTKTRRRQHLCVANMFCERSGRKCVRQTARTVRDSEESDDHAGSTELESQRIVQCSDAGDVHRRAIVLRARWNKLWPELYTEYDARHLKKELPIRNLISTEEAAAFFDAWAADEERHAEGFIQIMELVADGSEKDLWERLDAARSHNFSAINEYLKDEFSVMVMIAFDEMCTCHAYAADKGFYAGLGNDRFVRWLREVTADEAVHSMNAVTLSAPGTPIASAKSAQSSTA